MEHTPGVLNIRERLGDYRLSLKEVVKNRLSGSGFDQVFEIGFQLKTRKKLLDYLYDKYDTTTGKFVFENVALYFGLEDVMYMTGLPIDGKPVVLDDEPRSIDSSTCEDLIGLGLIDKKLSVSRLLDHVTESCKQEEYSNDELDKLCRAIALLGISVLVSQDNGKGCVDLSWISLLKNVDDIPKYSWGGACWANLHKGFKSTKSTNRTLYGCVFALEMWFLLRVPSLVAVHFPKKSIEVNATGFPLMVTCAKRIGSAVISDMKNMASTREYVKFFKDLNPEDVKWSLYSHVDLPICLRMHKAISKSITTVISRNFAQNHNPTVSLRQLLDGSDPLPSSVWLEWVGALPAEQGGKKTKTHLKICIDSWDRRWDCLVDVDGDITSPIGKSFPSTQRTSTAADASTTEDVEDIANEVPEVIDEGLLSHSDKDADGEGTACHSGRSPYQPPRHQPKKTHAKRRRKNEMMDQPKSKDKHQAKENPEPYVTKRGRKVKKTNVLNM